MSILEKATLEHNILAVSKLYEVVSIDTLASIINYDHYQVLILLE